MAPQTLSATRDVYHPDVDARGGGNVNKTTIEISERTLSILAFGFSLGAILMAAFTIIEFDFTRRHVEELRIRIENAENTLIISGLSKPRDMENGPAANPDRLKRKP